MNETIKILVIDDEKAIRNGCRRVLTGKGYEVITAENGQIGLDILAKKSMDIILLDLKMPVIGGEKVLETTRREYPDIPVIIITGHGTVDTAVVCMKNGAYDFITKPFQIDQFLLTITRAAEKRRLEQKARQFQEENIRNLYDLNLEKSRLKTIIQQMANGVMVTNRNLEVVLHNPALMRLMEIPEEIESPAPIAKIIHNISMQLIPTFIHRNMVQNSTFFHDVFLLGTAIKYKLTRSTSLNLEYHYRITDQDMLDGMSIFSNSFGVGLDIETGGHVFQIHLTNSLPMYESGFLTRTNQSWIDGGIHFGFNISREFTLK